MSEVRFYHLTRRPLEEVLPVMLERCLDRGWQALVASRDADRLAHLDDLLWTWRADSFLPHARWDGAGSPVTGGPDQPIWLAPPDAASAAVDALFLLDGAAPDPEHGLGRQMTAVLFDGADPGAVERARAQWRQVVGAGLKAIYWAQSPDGAWTRKAEST